MTTLRPRRQRNRYGVPMPALRRDPAGLQFQRTTYPVRGGTGTRWDAFLDGTLIGQWDRFGGGTVGAGATRHLLIADWRSACRDHVAAVIAEQMRDRLAADAGVPVDDAERAARSVVRALLG
jgi:hypothetical protein